MNLVGLPLSQLLLIGAVAGAVTVGLYLLKLRRRAVAVPFSKIWQRVLRDEDATSLFSQLKRLLSLLLQLALLSLLLFALGDPRLSTKLVDGRSIVVLVDASASMKATDTLPSRFDLAKAKLREMVRSLSGTDRVLIAQMDVTATPLSTMSSDVGELERAVDLLSATDARADFARALRFATDTLRGQPKPEIVVLSDGALGKAEDAQGPVHTGDARVSFVPFGVRGKNAGITEFSVRRYPLDKSRYEVLIEVTNATSEAMDVELSLLGDGKEVDVTKLRLQPEERLPRFFPNLSGAGRTLEAKLRMADGSRDDLPADDHAYALLPDRKRVRVQAVTAGNMYLSAALLLDEYLDVKEVTPDEYPLPGDFDVTIFDAVTPEVAKGSGNILYLDPKGERSPVKTGKEIKEFYFDKWDKKSPLLRFIVVDQIGVDVGNELVPGAGDKVIASVADEATRRDRPVVVEGRRDGHKFVALGFDTRRSDIVLRIAWPLLVLNVVNDFVEEDTRYVSSFKTGEVFRVPAPLGASSLMVRGPDKLEQRLPVRDGFAALLGREAGFYDVSAAGIESGFAANLSSVEESHIAPVKELVVDGRPAGELGVLQVGVRREVWLYLLVAVVLVSLLEWLTYHRRLTV